MGDGPPERIRTSDLCLRRAALYPAELRAVNFCSEQQRVCRHSIQASLRLERVANYTASVCASLSPSWECEDSGQCIVRHEVLRVFDHVYLDEVAGFAEQMTTVGTEVYEM